MTPDEERRLRQLMQKDPPTSGPRDNLVELNTRRLGAVQTIWLFLIRTPEGREGVPAVQVDQLAPIPEFMIATDHQRLAVWKQVAPQLAKETGCPISLYRWDGPRVLEQVYEPDPETGLKLP